MTHADGLRGIVNQALQTELEAGIQMTTIHIQLDKLGRLLTQLEIKELTDTLPGLRESIDGLSKLDARLYEIRSVLEEVERRL